jgi:hypothetical protein
VPTPSCLVCGATAAVGSLCREHAAGVPPCEGLIADHVRSTVSADAAAAWVVDGFGAAHALAPKSGIGRAQSGELVILTTSVSREHAELRQTPGGWTVRDLGSRNGTFVDGIRAQGHTPVPPRARLQVGDVQLWFLAELDAEPVTVGAGETGGGAGGLVRYQIAAPGTELCIVGSGDAGAGGALLFRGLGRADGATSWTERGLAPLEFQLLRVLCARATEEAGSPSLVRGCVPTKLLARELPFQSRFANEENVRQVVRRLRAVLAEAGAAEIVAVAPGRGYYINGAVEVARS